MGLRDELRRLEREAREKMIEIPQQDGTVTCFPQSAVAEAYMNLMHRPGAGEDASPEHPLIEAARNTSEPKWSGSFYATNDEGSTAPVEDLRE